DPAAPEDNEPLPAEEVVSPCFDVSRRSRPAAIIDFVEHGAIGLALVHRHEHAEVGGEFDLAGRIAWSQLQIDDLPVRCVRWIKFEMNLAAPLFIRPGVSPRLAPRIRLALLDFPADKFGGSGELKTGPNSEDQNSNASRHWRSPKGSPSLA